MTDGEQLLALSVGFVGGYILFMGIALTILSIIDNRSWKKSLSYKGKGMNLVRHDNIIHREL